MDANQTFIYALVDPNGWIRYVGQSPHPQNRFGNHRNAGSGLVQGWFAELARDGKEPRLMLFEKASPEKADEREQFWIETMLRAGAQLLNKEAQFVTEAPAIRKLTKVRPSVGSLALAAICAEKHGTQQRIRTELGVGVGVVGRWAMGKTRPETRYRLELERLYGIQITAWDETAKKASAA